jgi:hypothetical protein
LAQTEILTACLFNTEVLMGVVLQVFVGARYYRALTVYQPLYGVVLVGTRSILLPALPMMFAIFNGSELEQLRN